MAREGQTQISWATVSNGVLLLCAGALGGYQVRSLGAVDHIPYVLVLGTAATATVLMMILSAVAPIIFGDDPPSFPRTLTLPLAYSALLVLCVVMWTSTGNSLVLAAPQLDVTLFWANPIVLLLLAAIQFVALTFLGALGRRIRK